MNTKQKGLAAPPPAGINMRDIYYVLFRHKWMIGILIMLGVVSSAAVYTKYPFPYVSYAKIFIRYIKDTRGSDSDIDNSMKVQLPDNHGSTIINSEVETLTSMDLAVQAATNIGPARILGLGNTNVSLAAAVIEGNLKAVVPKESEVVILEYKANEPELARQVLFELINAYNSKYIQIHLTPGFSDKSLEQQKDDAQIKLTTAREALRETKDKVHITSMEDAKKFASERHSKIEGNISDVEQEIGQTEVAISELQKRIGMTNETDNTTNDALNSTLPQPSEDEISQYKELVETRDSRRETEKAWLKQFTADSPRVVNAKKLRVEAEANLKAFEDEHPVVLAVKSSPELARAGAPGAPAMNFREALQAETMKRNMLQNRLNKLNGQLTKANEQAAELDHAEDIITEEETAVKDASTEYEHFMLALEQARINLLIDNRVSNISTSQMPTRAVRDQKQVYKATFGVLGFFLLLALGLPFFIEMVLDQSLKSPMDVQARIPMPLFINIPRTNGHSKLPQLKPSKQVPLLNGANGENGSTPSVGAIEQSLPAVLNGNGNGNGHVAAWDERHELRPFFETLRDRLMTYFEMINLTHKPKLVAVTSCGPGAGVTTTAAGLASSLSEIGDGNVLLVSMNERNGEAQRFYKGKLTCGIEEVLQKDNRNHAQVQSNLFVAQEGNGDDRLPRVLPKRFSHLVPLLKASDYDYIIFDMPPVSEISVTPRLARFMDMVLLVIESEKTSRDVASRVASQLAESKTNVGMVLNKNRSYMPKRLEQSM